MKALVTGAGGFVGRHVVAQLLARGDQVRGLCRGEAAALREMGVEVSRGDLRDRDAVAAACQGVDIAFHVAAVAGIWGPWRHYHGVNTLGTEHVIAGCRVHGVPRLVYTSSPSVTFRPADQEGIDETTPYARRWLCHYAHTKALAEQRVLAANGDGLATCALRPHLIWGPGDPHLVPRLFDRARRGRLWRIGAGRNLIDTVFVENAAAAHLAAADALSSSGPVAGRAYYISQGEPVNCWEWIDSLLALEGIPPVRKTLSLGTAWCLGAVCEAVYFFLRLPGEPPMTRFLASQMAHSHYFSIDRARNDFGYRPAVSIEEGMRRLAASL